MLTEDQTREAVAVHEAAHAVAATLLGWRVAHVTLGEDDRRGLCVAHAPESADLLDRVIVAVAGCAGERLRDPHALLAQDDLAKVRYEILREHPSAPARFEQALLAQALAEADTLVRRGRRAIEALAELLLDVDEVPEHPARALILETLNGAKA